MKKTLLALILVSTSAMPAERLLCGFEPMEMDSLQGGLYGPGSVNTVALVGDSGFNYKSDTWTWNIRKENCASGLYALKAHVTYIGCCAGQTFKRTPYWTYYYPVFKSWERQASFVMYTHGWFVNNPRLRDWSDASRFRLDLFVKPVSAAATSVRIQVAVEDDAANPPIMRQFSVPVNSWITLETDLDQAVRERNLDLTKMTNLWVLGFSNSTVYVDNIRLAHSADTSALPLIRDSSSMRLPVLQPSTPVVPVPAATPDRTALAAPTPPAVVDSGFLAPAGFVGAFDNRHVVIAFNRFLGMQPADLSKRFRQPLLFKYSTDGGKAWTTPDSTRYPGAQADAKWNMDHASGRGNVVDLWGNGAWVSNTQGCVGFYPGPRQHVHLFDTDGAGWTQRGLPRMMDGDIRHCGHTSSHIIRQRFGAKAGRLWCAYGVHGRTHGAEVLVSYSDDNGDTWSTVLPGSAMIPGSRNRTWIFDTYAMPETYVVPYREHAAVFWQDERGLLWSAFDGAGWTAPEILRPNGVLGGSLRPQLSAVALGNNELFVTSAYWNGILHWNGSRWVTELADIPGGGPFSVCGDGVDPAKDRLLYFVPGDSAHPVRAFRRSAGGGWDAPLTLSDDSVAVDRYYFDSKYDKIGWMGISSQPYAPPNFAPVAWSAAGVVKMVLVPPLDYTPSPIEPVSVTGALAAGPRLVMQPNPFNSRVTISTRFSKSNGTAGRIFFYSLDGRLIFSRALAGEQDYFDWDARGLPNGMFAVRLVAGTTTLTRHLTLLK